MITAALAFAAAAMIVNVVPGLLEPIHDLVEEMLGLSDEAEGI